MFNFSTALASASNVTAQAFIRVHQLLSVFICGKAFPLPRRLAQNHRSRHPSVQRLHPSAHRNRNPRIRDILDLPRQPSSLIPNKYRHRLAQIRHSIIRAASIRRSRVRTSRHNLNPRHSQLRQEHRNRHPAQDRNPQTRSRRRPQSLRRPRISTPPSSHHPSSPKRFSRPHNRPNIPRILHPSHHHHQSRIAAQSPINRSQPAHHIIKRPRTLREKRRHSLRRLRPSHRRKQFIRSPQHPRTRNPRDTLPSRAQNPRQLRRLPGFAHQKRLRLQSRPQRVLHQFRPLHSNRFARSRPRPAQGPAKYLQPLILAAGNQLLTQV